MTDTVIVKFSGMGTTNFVRMTRVEASESIANCGEYGIDVCIVNEIDVPSRAVIAENN